MPACCCRLIKGRTTHEPHRTSAAGRRSGLRELLQEELEAEGYRVSACASAEAAQPLLQQGDIDLLISDLRLPGANGLSLLPVAQSLNPPRQC
ncbi:response regulator [Halopseudomonas pachastrellae]|nr:response regulator [Halopseudomonas pachastrellae]